MAKILHTSDWHLGFSMRERRLHEDQVHVLEQIIKMVRDHKPDVVLIAGDIYDRPVAPAPSMELFDHFISTVGLELNTPVVVIPGNHDSAERIGHFRRLLNNTPVHLVGKISADLTPLVLEDEHGPYEIFGLPYLYPAHVKAALGEDSQVNDAESATQAMVKRIHEAATTDRRVLVAHAFVMGGQVCDSEQNIVGNVTGVPADVFNDFSYVALGHLHRPQKIGSERVQYSGSILKYSASEVNYTKSVNLLEIDVDGKMSHFERLPLTPIRDLRVVTGTFEDILKEAGENPSEDFILAHIDDSHTIPNAMSRLQAHYPNCLHIRPTFLDKDDPDYMASSDVRNKNMKDVFTEFWQLHKEEVPGADLIDLFQEALAQAEKEARGGES